MSAKILLAGGTGVLGARTLPRLLAAGHHVVAVSRRDASDTWLQALGAEPVRLDVFDPDAVTEAAAGVDVVVNLATHVPGMVAGLRSTAWETHHRLRRDGSSAMAEAAIRHGVRFVQESVVTPYPSRRGDWIGEDVRFVPVDQTTSVVAAESSAARVSAAGLAGVALRFGVFYHATSPHTLAMLAQARRGRLAMPGHEDAFVSMVHVDDAADAVVAALSVAPGTYNVVEDRPRTRGEQGQVLAELVGRRRVRPLPGWTARLPNVRVLARSQRVSNLRLRSVSDWTPRHPDVHAGWAQVVDELAAR